MADPEAWARHYGRPPQFQGVTTWTVLAEARRVHIILFHPRGVMEFGAHHASDDGHNTIRIVYCQSQLGALEGHYEPTVHTTDGAAPPTRPLEGKEAAAAAKAAAAAAAEEEEEEAKATAAAKEDAEEAAAWQAAAKAAAAAAEAEAAVEEEESAVAAAKEEEAKAMAAAVEEAAEAAVATKAAAEGEAERQRRRERRRREQGDCGWARRLRKVRTRGGMEGNVDREWMTGHAWKGF